jgi:hypothetical protein
MIAVVLLIVLILAGPDTIALALAPRPNSEAGPWSLLWLASALSAVSVYLLLGCLLLALEQLSRHAQAQQDDRGLIRQGGIVFAVLTFYWWDERWFYIPITLLLGWLLAAKLALPRNRASTQTEAFYNRVAQLAVRLRASEPVTNGEREGRQEARRDANGKAKESTEQPEPETDTQPLEPRTQPERLASERAGQVSVTKEPAALRRRLSGGGWSHGLQAGLWGLLLGAPLSGLYLWEFGRASVDPSEYEMLDLLVAAASWIILQWAIFGFFFGYFYRYLRGHSGIPKALSLFALVVLPPLPFHAAWSQPEAWRAYGFFVLQMFVFTMLLGLLAGDYLLLRRVGLGWRQFLELQNLRFVLAWGSSVAVALGGIITTLLTTGVGAVVSAFLEQAGIGGGGPSGPQGP